MKVKPPKTFSKATSWPGMPWNALDAGGELTFFAGLDFVGGRALEMKLIGLGEGGLVGHDGIGFGDVAEFDAGVEEDGAMHVDRIAGDEGGSGGNAGEIDDAVGAGVEDDGVVGDESAFISAGTGDQTIGRVSQKVDAVAGYFRAWVEGEFISINTDVSAGTFGLWRSAFSPDAGARKSLQVGLCVLSSAFEVDLSSPTSPSGGTSTVSSHTSEEPTGFATRGLFSFHVQTAPVTASLSRRVGAGSVSGRRLALVIHLPLGCQQSQVPPRMRVLIF